MTIDKKTIEQKKKEETKKFEELKAQALAIEKTIKQLDIEHAKVVEKMSRSSGAYKMLVELESTLKA